MSNDPQVAWKFWSASDGTPGIYSAWHVARLPYAANSNALQNVDVWLPKGDEDNELPGFTQRPGLWIIYIHGGAWRDPLVDSSSFTQTVRHLLADNTTTTGKIAGLASINYSLSPHPHHPDFPAPVPQEGATGIPSRDAQHPDHIVDVLSAVQFLNSKFGFQNDYVLVGHSCGATLALQVAMDRSTWTSVLSQSDPAIAAPKPTAIVGLNGLYDLPQLIAQPGDKHRHLAQLYEGFTRLAFGENTDQWAAVSPTSVENWSETWKEGKEVVLVQSHEDSLVPYSQTELMFKNLHSSAGGQLQIEEMDADGDHNDLWKKGNRLAEILTNVLQHLP